MSCDSLYRSLLFAYDWDTTFVSAGVTYLRDFGPLGLHIPMPGSSPTRYTDGSYTFNGANQYLIMDATTADRLWAALPDGWTDYTFICKAFHRAPAANDRIFSARTAAIVNQLEYYNITQERLALVPSGSIIVSYETVNVPLTGLTRVSIHSGRCNAGAVAPTRYYNLYDGGVRPTGGVSGTGTPVFDRTVRPTIGRASPAGPQYFDGRLYYLAALKCVPTPDEVSEISQLFEGQRKPWCRLP